MPVQPDQKYVAKLIDIQATQSPKGNFGLVVDFETTNDGPISRTLWVTSDALVKTREMLVTLGATDAELANWEWLQAPKSLCGRVEVEVIPEETVGTDGVRRIEVKWINSLRRRVVTPTNAKAQAAALMMRREPEPGGFVERSRPRTAGPVASEPMAAPFDPNETPF